jgi:flavin-dependent dehydrogenase
MMYDAAVIGAGPAGSAAAIELARAGAKVLLLEKSAFPRHKVCGEFLSPEVATVLKDLGCAELLEDALRIECARVHTASQRNLGFPLDPCGHSLSRFTLDMRLVAHAVRLGATFQPNTNVAAHDVLPARLAIPAWGRRIRENITGGFFGFKAHFIGDYPRQVDLHFFRGGYVGISPVENGRINVCALVEKQLLRDAERIARQVVGRTPRQEWPFLFTGPLHPGWQGGSGLAAGDAAAFLDPFTGDGISLALRSGRLAARAALALLSSSSGAEVEYQTQLRRMCRGQFAVARILRFGLQRSWIESPVSRLLAGTPRLRRAVFGATRGNLA